MLKSKVIDVFKALSGEELKHLRDFIRSPYHNKNKNVMGIFELIRKYAPDFDNENISKEKLFSGIFPHKEYNDIVMRILLSDLMRLTEDFLVYKQVKKSENEYKTFLLKDYMERKIDRMFLKEYKESGNGHADMKIDDSYYQYRFSIEELNKGFNIDRNMQHLNSKNLVDMGNYLIIYFLIKMSSVVHDIDVNRGNFNLEFNENSIKGFLSFVNPGSIKNLIKNEEFRDREFLEMYYYVFLMNDDEIPDDIYFRLKELFYKNIRKMDRGAAYNMFLAILNYTGKKHWNDTDNKYRKETLDTYKEMLKLGIYSWSEGVYMTIIMFRSILTMCSLLKEIEWMEYFIENYIDKLQPDQRQNMYHFAQAKLCFAKRDYNGSLDNISKVNYKLFTFKFDVKTLMLQIYYELGFYEEAAAMMDSFKHFLNNNKNVSQVFKEWNMNFLNFYNELINHKSGRKKTDIELLMKRIESTPNSASPLWLKNKAFELA